MQWSAVKSLAAGFVHRKDINWDELQPLALDEICQSLTVQENENAISLPLNPSSLSGLSEAFLPQDFARPRAVFSGNRELVATDLQGMLAQGFGGATRFYAISGMKLYAAAASSPLALVYSARVPILAGDTDHNFLSDRYSPILLYGLLCQAAHKIQDFDALEAHTGELATAIGEANAAYAMSTLSAGAESRTPYAVVRN
jgi:hypothetical protein